jgi:hypothetical protein
MGAAFLHIARNRQSEIQDIDSRARPIVEPAYAIRPRARALTTDVRDWAVAWPRGFWGIGWRAVVDGGNDGTEK